MTDARLQHTYADARDEFRAAADAAGARLQSFPHPRTGLEGEALSIDVAELGPADASSAVLVVSGTHGVEGYCGSALQSHWLRTGSPARPDDVGVVMVHALNPFGFSWVRRTDEGHVDLNRNFIDWSTEPPRNDAYDRIAELLVPAEWTPESLERTDAALFELLAATSLEELQQTISGGQYTHSDGVFFGGTGPSWSNEWLRSWSAHRFGSVDELAILDLHTGLGPWGHGELISSQSLDSPHHARASKWWGEVTSMVDGDSVSALLVGDWLDAAPSMVPDVEMTAVALEFGTVDTITVLQALREDAWLHSHGDPTAPSARATRDKVRAAFADDDPAWIDQVRTRFDEVLEQTFAGLRSD